MSYSPFSKSVWASVIPAQVFQLCRLRLTQLSRGKMQISQGRSDLPNIRKKLHTKPCIYCLEDTANKSKVPLAQQDLTNFADKNKWAQKMLVFCRPNYKLAPTAGD